MGKGIKILGTSLGGFLKPYYYDDGPNEEEIQIYGKEIFKKLQK